MLVNICISKLINCSTLAYVKISIRIIQKFIKIYKMLGSIKSILKNQFTFGQLSVKII